MWLSILVVHTLPVGWHVTVQSGGNRMSKLVEFDCPVQGYANVLMGGMWLTSLVVVCKCQFWWYMGVQSGSEEWMLEWPVCYHVNAGLLGMSLSSLVLCKCQFWWNATVQSGSVWMPVWVTCDCPVWFYVNVLMDSMLLCSLVLWECKFGWHVTVESGVTQIPVWVICHCPVL